MNFHRVSHLNHQDVRITELTVHSYEMGRYLAEVDFDGRRGFIVDDNNKPQQFQSINALRDALHSCTVHRAYLVHQSAYDEMCGASEKVDNTLKVPLVL